MDDILNRSPIYCLVMNTGFPLRPIAGKRPSLQKPIESIGIRSLGRRVPCEEIDIGALDQFARLDVKLFHKFVRLTNAYL
jgi:hypothetical protein